MGRTKEKQIELKQEEQIVKESNPAITETHQPKEIKSRKANGRFVENNVIDAIYVYLQTKPYNEVANLINSLSSSPALNDVDLTIP